MRVKRISLPQKLISLPEFVVDSTRFKLFEMPCFEEVPIKGKVVIVTGSNSGIGKRATRDLAERGATVIN